MRANEQDVSLIIRQISDVLMINGGFLRNQGLYTGEMGLVLFFARYARHTQNDLYMDYAYRLLGKIRNGINRDMPISYKQGLAGIGSAIEYLVQNNYFEADTDEVLEDFDQRIFFTYNLPCLLIEEIIDIGYYANWRLSGNSSKKDLIRQTILPQIEKTMRDKSVNPALNLSGQKTMPDSFEEKTSGHCLELIAKNDFWNKDLGFQSGLVGWGLSLLTELDGDNTWFPLLPSNSKDAMHAIPTNH